ncbi:DoxX-like family protein [Cohnella sp. WQ 127256]|uniref:DoxX-like family protein n=1 Tax=Cohnella sp. WQ 127256 TaxID=2938790 RepID=UPI002117EA13|nr:DoxX-like family protein [Cohnella sp. WQ 127256]
MKSKPIYVEIKMQTKLDQLWKYTQTPELHQEWDLRFSEIAYLPREIGDPLQKFLYRTRIGFGLNIKGTGETKAITQDQEDQPVSTLKFGSEQRISLIRIGGGYWKYKPDSNGREITFITQYDYQTRFGAVGRWMDRLLFRPLFGYATAWSFDRLRIWLEKGTAPVITMERTLGHYLSVISLMLIWLYQGIVPKLLFPESGEMTLLRKTGWFPGSEEVILSIVGAAEVGFALLLYFKHRKKWVFKLQALALLVLGIAAIIGSPELLQASFNPLTLSIAMGVLGLFAMRTIHDLPNAANCLRRPSPKSIKAGS